MHERAKSGFLEPIAILMNTSQGPRWLRYCFEKVGEQKQGVEAVVGTVKMQSLDRDTLITSAVYSADKRHDAPYSMRVMQAAEFVTMCFLLECFFLEAVKR